LTIDQIKWPAAVSLDGALRVAAKCTYAGSTNVITLAPGTSTPAGGLKTTTYADSNVIIANTHALPTTPATPVEVTVYVYYDGEDAACTSNNAAPSITSSGFEITFGSAN